MITLRISIPLRWFLIFFLSSCNVAALTVVPVGSHSKSSGPSTLKKPVNMSLPALVDEKLFFGRSDEGCCHSMLMCLVAGSKRWYHVSSGAMILERNWFSISWYRIRCFMEENMRGIFCSSIKCFGTHYARNFRYRNISCSIV
ncbi:hypothetical protein NPIL_698981 [Nephila pilipes]|uniref:Uncharacterized protein n=1 Tax=Nephila pilipes TaxID=299642 RepID=A0A8X6QL22_NEPPI|nr:hypothetical protein NPIL_698981 [Nephila pilipes]